MVHEKLVDHQPGVLVHDRRWRALVMDAVRPLRVDHLEPQIHQTAIAGHGHLRDLHAALLHKTVGGHDGSLPGHRDVTLRRAAIVHMRHPEHHRRDDHRQDNAGKAAD